MTKQTSNKLPGSRIQSPLWGIAASILFVAAAGNSGYNCDTSSSCYPAENSNSNLIAVASIDSNGALSSFSNYGATTIDIGAPGRGIRSTVPVKVVLCEAETMMLPA